MLTVRDSSTSLAPQELAFPSGSVEKTLELFRIHHEKKLKDFNQSSGSLDIEEAIAKALTASTLSLIPAATVKSGIYRATAARTAGEGNCIALSEQAREIGLGLDLTVGIAWDGAHATSLWAGKAAVWEIDGYFGTQSIWLDEHPLRPLAHAVVRKAFLQKTGLFLLHSIFDDDISNTEEAFCEVMQFETTPDPETAVNPFKDINGEKYTILPPNASVAFLEQLNRINHPS